MAELQTAAGPVQVSGVRISAEALAGQVVPGTSLRGAARTPLLQALADLGLRLEAVVGVDATPVAEAGTLVVEVEPPQTGQGKVLLVDDGGALSWILPEPAGTLFRVPVAAEPGGGMEQRGLLGKLARRVVHVLTFDLIQKVAGGIAERLVGEWEKENRRYRLREFAPDRYRAADAPELDAAALRALAGGPALLLIHDTNTLSHTGFARLPPDAVAGLHTRYEGRIFAFDHPTLSVDPLDNAKALAALLPDDVSLEVDVLAHGRGGLVARVLTELADTAGTSGKLKVRQVVFVATPNAGTPLADVEHIGKLVDALTNLLDLVPDNPVTESLVGIVQVVRQVATGGAKELVGLTAMSSRPDERSVLTLLNRARPHGSRYRAIATDYEPPPNTSRARWARDAAIDVVFGWEPNDLLVPTASAYAWNGADGFPIAERVVLSTDRGVDHSTIWTAPEVLAALNEWLSPAASALQAQTAMGPVHLAQGVDDPLAEVDERLAAGDMEGVRQAVRSLPATELRQLQVEVGEVALDSFVSRGLKEPKAGVVFVLPGIMGTNLWADDGGGDRDRIWLNALRLVKGDFRRLRVTNGGGTITAGGLHRSYLPLVMALDQGWEVIPAGYDWRLPVEAAAESLAQRIRDRSGGRPMPAHLVCHSMGGLVARTLIATHPDVWRDLDSPDDRSKGGRLVMLGTPTLGSFAIALALSGDDHLVQWLARIDARNSRDEILDVIGTFPGAYQLLTSPDVAIDGSAHDQLYDSKTWGSKAIAGSLLDAARDMHRRLAAAGFDPARTCYVAGAGHATPAAVRIDDGTRGRFSYRMTRAGDGRVTHELGIPRRPDGEPVFGKGNVWYSTAEHGDLTKDKAVVAAVVDLLEAGTTSRLASTPPASARGAAAGDGAWTPAELVEPPIDAGPKTARRARSRGAPVGTRAQLRAEAQMAADAAVDAWLGSMMAPAEAVPVLDLRVLHASLEYSSYPVMVGHYSGDVIRGAEGHLDRNLGGQLTARQFAGRYPETIGQVLLVPTGRRPPGAIIVGLGPSGDLTPSTLAAAVRQAALEHALAWREGAGRMGEGTIGLSTCLMGSYGLAGLTLPTSIAAIVEGVVLANISLATATSTGNTVQIGSLEFVERYAGTAEEAAHVIRDIETRLPGALQDAVDLRPDLCLRPGEGRRPAVRTADYGAGQWHRIVVRTGKPDEDGRVRLRFTSFASRARADELVQEVDTKLLRRMLEEAVVSPAANGRVNTALFELLFHNDVKRDLTGIENVHLVVDDAAADFPWEVLSDRGGAAGAGPVALRGGFLRQLSSHERRQLDPLAGVPGALVIGDPPGGDLFDRLEGARREAQEVADLLDRTGHVQVERLIFPAQIPPGTDTASQVVTALLASDFHIVHIAAHGHFQQRKGASPIGGVVIGPEAYLTASTLRSMRRPPDVVFLNCCHLGSLRARNLDDPSPDDPAFTRARLNELAASLSNEVTAMGVRAVVVAGWAVADLPAAEFARTFYSQMLDSVPFGDAVQAARQAAFAADGGASNTWAAYQCYGDPAFRLRHDKQGSTPSTVPVSADEMQRRLEDIEVAARDADPATKAELSRRVQAQYPVAEREWPRKSRMWTAFGWAHATIGETEPAINAYRRALDRQDRLAPLKAVEELACLEHELYLHLTRTGAARSEALDPPATAKELRRVSWQRLTALDRLGRSSERHAVRARWHEGEAALLPVDKRDLSPAAREYVEAWRLSDDDIRRRDPTIAVNVRHLVALGAELPVKDLEELDGFLEEWRSAQPSADDRARLVVADLVLADRLASIGEGGVAEVVPAYVRAFEADAPEQRTKVTKRIAELAALVDEGRAAALSAVAEALRA